MMIVTVGGLELGTTYAFSMTAMSSGGLESGSSQLAIIVILFLPGKDHTVSNISVSAIAVQTIYKAEFLVPYAFVHIFI
jgi:hypothetical protein